MIINCQRINPRLNYLQIAEWVERVIKSCTTEEQLEGAERLLNSYKKQTNSEHYLYINRYLNHSLLEKSKDLKYRR